GWGPWDPFPFSRDLPNPGIEPRCKLYYFSKEQLKELTKQYEKSENDLKALQSVGQVGNGVRDVEVMVIYFLSSWQK
uniref:Uncharacterized protein n=1 Tax=Bos mutus grunniens TaxID=30521 RepID=A0A8B9WMS4_BOSMU